MSVTSTNTTTCSTATSTGILDGLRDPKNDGAWRDFVNRYRPLVLGFARRRGLGDADAEDAAQESLQAFATAYQDGKYDRDRGRLRDWLGGIARNQIAKVGGKRNRKEILLGPDTGSAAILGPIPDPHDPEKMWEYEWRLGVFRACLKECRPLFDAKTMEAFDLFAWQGRPAREVAEQLGLTENAVFLIKHRVMRKIRELRPAIEAIF